MQRSKYRYLILIVGILLFLANVVYADASLQLSREEYQFIEEYQTVRLGIDPKFMPFEFLDEQGIHTGIAADLLSLISERTGLSFTYDPTLSWTETIGQAREGSIDVLSAVGYTREREEFLSYLPAYIHFQRAIIVQKSNTSVTSFSDLQGRQVAVQRGSSHEGFLTSYPSITPRLYDTVEEALLAVNHGEEVAFVGNEATSVYLSRLLGLTELTIIPITEDAEQTLHIAVQRNEPILANILRKGLDSISEAERAQIFNKWIRYETRIDYWPIIRIAIVIAIIIILAFALSSYWIVRLKKAILEKEEAQMRAEEADREKSRFLARISHEIRTPLNGVRGMSFLLEKTPLSTDQRRYVQSISTATQTMQQIINDILEYSRLEENKITFESVPFHLDDVLENCVSIEQYLIQQKGLDFRITEEAHVPKRFIGDPTRLSQILINLMNNAVKFTEHGSITLSIASKDKAETSCTLIMSVSDTGIGMSKEQLDTIFTPFVQANETIHRKYGGSGLGLSIVKELVEKMQGKLEVESKPGEGTRFTVSLPMQLNTDQDERSQASVDFSSLKALIVIQDRMLYDRLALVFTEYQIQYEGVTSFGLALKALEETHDYDLLVMEYHPSMVLPDGLYKLLSNQTASRPKLLVISPDRIEPEKEQLLSCDLVIMLPLINSVLFNGLLQLFGTNTPSLQTAKEKVDREQNASFSVLVVEDNATNQIIAKELFEQIDATVYLASNGKEGYERFLEHEDIIDCILMDLHMDVMNGYESSKLIREKNQEVPLLVTSADLISSVLNRCKEIGVTEVIGKPYSPEELQRKVLDYAGIYASKKALNDTAIDFQRGILQLGGNEKAYNTVLHAFIEETSSLVEALTIAGDSQDWKEVAELAHQAKGSCGAIGATGAQKLCAELQHEQPTDDHALWNKTIEELERVLAQARLYLGL
ncbi:transporter substrate-binding domain-containing protein [Sphaerochaeta sp. S2]|uniref:ATP-binding protein n=1 Tax=Sphaerochaeta sp. S2 TaxID=2798868 RepID=UPI0018E9709E|nr:transporter substrate-binding domain-containing protein [Sphaerochaeta sp. S2]MBJ2357223.1 transporter substrate-binding domain-containing protein [Sphaerochaeta sp. S2]